MNGNKGTARADGLVAGKTAGERGEARTVALTLDELAEVCGLLRLVEEYAQTAATLADAATWRERLNKRWAKGGAA